MTVLCWLAALWWFCLFVFWVFVCCCFFVCLWVFWLAIAVVFNNYGRSFILAKNPQKMFSCLLCDCCAQTDMQLTNGSDLLYDLDKTLLYFLICFLHLWNEEKTFFSPRWSEQLWCICVLWDPWQGAIEMSETPVVLLGFRCRRALNEHPACISSWRTSKTPSNSERRS